MSGRGLGVRERRAGTGTPAYSGAPPLAEAHARAAAAARLIISELEGPGATNRRCFTWASAMRTLKPHGLGAADIAHAIGRLTWENAIEPVAVAGQLGWRRTRAPVLEADAAELAVLRVAQRRFLAARGWERATVTPDVRPREHHAKRTLRARLLTTDERWAKADLAGFPMPIDEAVQMQAVLDEIAVAAPPAQPEIDRALAEIEAVGRSLAGAGKSGPFGRR